MIKIKNIVHTLEDITNRYGLRILSLDFTDITLISRIGFSFEIFIQIYINVRKDKVNMALVVADERIYGIDKEGGIYHEHPFENPSLHTPAERIEIEEFVVKSLEILKNMKLV
ncbi:MAG TPA: hypothetical protein ACFYEF_08785 [Candidatus Wunengus sp. YC63]|uniref:hypothetical protein n=1 Tax=Candidatus Wunengus sp. YC63 TaxID=3367699 RepID=UPI004025F42F